MGLSRQCSVLLSAAVLVIACGGSDSTTVNGPAPDGGNGNDSSNGSGDSGNDSSVGDSGNGNDSSPGADSGFPCPDESGAYTVMLSGQGCGDTNASAPECIKQQACVITMVSLVPNGKGALNGTTPIANDGSFMNAAIKEGTANRTGCVATWDDVKSTLTVDCGGVNTTQSCRAVLVRTKALCN